MVLSDNEIKRRVSVDQLISNYHWDNIQNCGYFLRAGKAFQPETGQEELLGTLWDTTRKHVWEIGQAETLVVMTQEKVKIPVDLCATYTPLHRLARQGVMLLNASIVEPGYEGPLSCFLVNFSSQRISLEPNEKIAKIIFHTLSSAPGQLHPLRLDEQAYQSDLARCAKTFHKSFMDVTGIEDRAVAKAAKETKRLLLLGGVLVAVLIAWSSLEPTFSKWVWNITGARLDTTHRLEAEKLQHEIQKVQMALTQLTEQAKQEARKEELHLKLLQLQSDIVKLRTDIEATKSGQNTSR